MSWYIVMRVQMQDISAPARASAFPIDAESGWMRDARRVDSPNCDERPFACAPELIVVHGISLPPGKYGGGWIDALFTNTLPAIVHEYFAAICVLRVSAHLLITRDGAVTQFVPFHRRAWHAGESQYRGRPACNDFSIGIELEGTDEEPYAESQYASLGRVIGSLRAAYPSLAQADVVGHCDVAPGRKTDPGPAFDWARLRALLRTVGRAP
jgi:N-acetyl-anhydromuramoyl-L-alanine amidase